MVAKFQKKKEEEKFFGKIGTEVGGGLKDGKGRRNACRASHGMGG